MADYLETYCKTTIRTNTYQRYLLTAESLKPISKLPMQKVSAYTIQKFYNELPEMSDSSKSKIHKLLKAAATKALELNIISKNFMNAVKAPKDTQKQVTVFTKEELSSLLESIKANKYYDKYYPYKITETILPQS